MNDEFRIIHIDQLVDPSIVLREVDQTSVEYLEMRDSLQRLGFLNSICVRPCKRDPAKHEVVDGRYRVAGARDVRIEGVPSIIKYGITDRDVIAMQITANAQRPTTSATDFARQIKRLLKSDAGMTQAELCQLLHKEPRWIRKMLGISQFVHLRQMRKAIDSGKMSLDAAYCLSRLPRDLWVEFFTDACVLPLQEFRSLVMTTLRKRRAMIYAGKLDLKQNSPMATHPFLRSLTEVRTEIDDTRIGPLQIATHRYETPVEIWKAALEWAAHLDPESIERHRRIVLKRLQKSLVARRKCAES